MTAPDRGPVPLWEAAFYERVRRILRAEASPANPTQSYPHMSVAGLDHALRDVADLPAEAVPWGRTLQERIAFMSAEALAHGLVLEVAAGIVWYRIASE